jgi:hypothetical protein
VLLRDARKDAVPVGAAEVSGGAEGGDSVLLRTDVLHEDVRHIVVLDLGGQVYVNLDAVLHVLLLDGVQERVEPLGGAKVADDPSKVDLMQSARFSLVFVHCEEGTGHGLPWRDGSAWSC